MEAKRIISFLNDIKKNNTREWFHAHKTEYMACRKSFEADIEKAILRLSEIDKTIAHITVKDATYRFNRDTRFSPDKSPYKTHFGAYIAAHGKKALHGGYYIHVEPDNCFVSCGNYWLPTNILTSCRNEIMGNIDEWRSIVEGKAFQKLFGKPGKSRWGDKRGFGLERLKSCPSGFPRDYEHIEYLRMKDYCAWHGVDAALFESDNWYDSMIEIIKVGKPMMDFINNVIDDYE